MSNDLETLFLPFLRGDLPVSSDQTLLFLNAQYHPHFAQMPQLKTQQFFKPYVRDISAHSFTVSQTVEGLFDYVLVLLPKNMMEAKGLVALGLSYLSSDGVIVCAADNKAGGTRLRKILQDFNCQNIIDDSKNKARVAWGKAGQIQQDMVQAALRNAAECKICDGQFISVPGVFGWDKIDHGSEILAHMLPEQLAGKGADFGCGYGYLSEYVLRHKPKVKKIFCADADYRAVQLCRQNLSAYEGRAEFLWEDLLSPIKSLHNLDFVVMNPPFHEGKLTDNAIGQVFIKNAALALRKGGALYMVANRHLPYEDVLHKEFEIVEKIKETNGFKIFAARK